VGKIAFLFPGQGSQRVGMGADIAKNDSDLFERYLVRADHVSNLPVSQYCLEGPEEALTETQVAQPALFSLSMALLEVARKTGLRPDYVAGHSLGEYTAAVASGALEFEEGLALVSARGRLMSDIQGERPGAMAAIIGMEIGQVRDLCGAASSAGLVGPANLNSPTQIVVSGEEAAIERVVELAKEAGAEKAVRLKVGSGFHSPLMEPVQAKMAQKMETVRWSNPRAPMAGNAAGKILTSGEEIHQALIAQIASPVRWVECVQALLQAGCDTFLELGSGRVLTGLVRQINPEVDGAACDTPAKVQKFAQEHPSFLA
jgi:[acyl-carrier-protein] S-malonyltransferase